jgi:hypothetical protein
VIRANARENSYLQQITGFYNIPFLVEVKKGWVKNVEKK